MKCASVAASMIGIAFCQGVFAAGPPPSSLQQQAEFLAGLPLGKGSILHALQKSPEYRQHQKELQEQWAFCRQARYGSMQQWSREHLAHFPATRGVVRYLFGGPDFLNAFAFFPDASVIVLGGLEPVGEVPPPEALDATALGIALKALNESLHTSLFCGYFITSEMKPQLVRGSFRGVLPVLYTELALTGNVIDSVTMVRPFGSPGVEITYHRPGGPAQMLYYFQADLSNGKECRRLLAWLEDLGLGASYLKAASYLLLLDSFSETRNFLLRTSSLILQDDSGLPFRSFLPDEWRIQLFGVYTDPLPIFKLRRDTQLDEAYHSGINIAPLPFGAGYHVRADDANLLLATRTGSTSLSGGEMSLTVSSTPASPAFSTPTPKAKLVRIRKALPVPIKKAIAIPTPTPEATPSPIPISQATPEPTVVPVATPSATPEPSSTPVTTLTPVEEKAATPEPAPAENPPASAASPEAVAPVAPPQASAVEAPQGTPEQQPSQATPKASPPPAQETPQATPETHSEGAPQASPRAPEASQPSDATNG